jgi:hypothetical protein
MLLYGLVAVMAQGPCSAAATAPRPDHVVLAVADLNTAAARFAARGFRFKPGHPCGRC